MSISKSSDGDTGTQEEISTEELPPEPPSPLPTTPDSGLSSLVSTKPLTESSTGQSRMSERQSCHSQNKTFHRRFSQVDASEELINYFSCALIAEILLQGFLYISENYFAFYSNIFGYKTKLLIPISDVITITKEKTVKFIPNAVGICTVEGKYVFGSLLSRDTTFRVMHSVWSNYLPLSPLGLQPLQLKPGESADTGSDTPSTPAHGDSNDNHLTSGFDGTGKNVPPILVIPEESGVQSRDGTLRKITSSPNMDAAERSSEESSEMDSDMKYMEEEMPIKRRRYLSKYTSRPQLVTFKHTISSVTNLVKKLKQRNVLLTSIIILLVVLFISAAVLMYKINNLHNHLEKVASHKGGDMKAFYVKQQMTKISAELRTRIDEVSQTRQSLANLLDSIENLATYCTSTNGGARNSALTQAERDQCIP